MFYLKTLTPLWLLLVISLPTGADETSSGASLYNPEQARNLVWSPQPNHKWVLGHPIANGRIGGMVVGHPLRERIGLNHDRLWRQYYSFRKYDTASIMPEFRRLCAADRFSEAQDLLLSKCVKEATLKYGGIDLTSAAVNPMVPVGDLGIYPTHKPGAKIEAFRRSLDLDTGIATVQYRVDQVDYKRESFVSWPAGVLVTRLTASQPGQLSGEVSLSRLLDPACFVTGKATPGHLLMEAEFDEGVRFATATRVINKGGQLSAGIETYQAPPGDMPPKYPPNTFSLHWWGEPRSDEISGVTNRYTGADEIILLVSIATEDESPQPAEWCRKKLAATPVNYQKLRAEHVKDHRQFYRRVQLRLGDPGKVVPTEKMVEQAVVSGEASPLLLEKLFNMGRYLAITSGRPQPADQPPKCPITLQGIWNQDRRPAWDCDLTSDLNLEMCYWPLNMMDLGELIEPLNDWLITMIPQAREAAMDRYGCRGIFINLHCSLRDIGGVDRNCIVATGAAAWLGQILWQHWEYTQDKNYLREKLYPFLKEVGLFYEDNLVDIGNGQLAPCPSCSPEMLIKGRHSDRFYGGWANYNVLARAGTWDLELVRDTFTHLLKASEILGQDANQRKLWSDILAKVPLPVIDETGRMLEWTIQYEEADPGHRHRSHMVGLAPGTRITMEDTPDYFQGARLALDRRHAGGVNTGMSFSTVLDANFHARLYEGDKAREQLNFTVTSHIADNLLTCLCGFREGAPHYGLFRDKQLFQIESAIGIVASISEMFFQDARGLLRLLPALPSDITSGDVHGFRARSGFKVDIRWEHGQLVESKIRALRSGPCRVKSFHPVGQLSVLHNGIEIKTTYHDGITEFPGQRGETYVLAPKSK